MKKAPYILFFVFSFAFTTSYAGLFCTDWKGDTSYSIYGEMRISSYRQKKRVRVPVWQERNEYYNSCGEKYLADNRTFQRQFVPKVLKFDYQEYDTTCDEEKQSSLNYQRHQNHLSFKYYSDSNLIASNLTGDSLKVQLYSSFKDPLQWIMIPPYKSKWIASLLDYTHFDLNYIEVLKGDKIVSRIDTKYLFSPFCPVYPAQQVEQEIKFSRDTLSSQLRNDYTPNLGEYWYVSDSIEDLKKVILTRDPYKQVARFLFSDHNEFDFEAGRIGCGDYSFYLGGYYQSANGSLILSNVDNTNQVWKVFKVWKINEDSMQFIQTQEQYLCDYYEINPITEYSPRNDLYIFPKFSSENSNIDSIINNTLANDLLDNNYQDFQYSIFENIWGQGDSVPVTMFDIDYQINQSSRRLLSMEISAEGCGAYCEYFTMNYNFDVATGANIQLAELIEDSLELELLQLIKNDRINQIDSVLKEIRHVDVSKIKDPDELEYETMRKDLFETCIQEDYWEDLKDISFTIIDERLVVKLGRCSAHYNRNVDEIGDFKIRFSFDKLERFLSSHGKNLLFVVNH